MRAVFVNYSHPDTPHVSGVRVPSFARAMARRGHQVVLLTRTASNEDPGSTPLEVERTLREHDWTAPLLVTVRPLNDPLLRRMREGRLPAVLRKPLTAWFLLRHGGVYRDWSSAARPIEATLASAFRPEMVWATFLPSDALVIAQRLARSAGCPWYMDLKDAWTHRLPIGTRRWMARKFSDAKAITANSRFHGEQGERWLGREVKTLYDGIDEEFLEAGGQPQAPGFRITLIGGTYGREKLLSFLHGVRAWLESLPELERKNVVFSYAGSDSAEVAQACRAVELGTLCRTDIRGYLALRELAALCAQSAVNCYLWLATTFHHKLLELLACGRPVIAFPGEHEEALELASRLRGELRVCRSVDAVIQALYDIRYEGKCRRCSYSNIALFDAFKWDAQVRSLED